MKIKPHFKDKLKIVCTFQKQLKQCNFSKNYSQQEIQFETARN